MKLTLFCPHCYSVITVDVDQNFFYACPVCGNSAYAEGDPQIKTTDHEDR